jgi:hypothetical protein
MMDVRDKQDELHKSQTKLALHQAKLQGLIEAKNLAEPVVMKPRSNVTVRKRTRALSDQWKAILVVVDQESIIDGSFTYDDLDRAAKRTGHEATRDTLRSQMSLYKQAGFVEAGPEAGSFRLTDAGRKAAGIDGTDTGATAPNENEAPNGQAAGASEAASSGGATPWPAFGSNPHPWHRA